MHKTLIINQPFIKDFCRCQRWPARTRGRAIRPPDWLCYAAAVLKKDGHDVELYDFIANGWDKEKLRELICGKKPDFVVLDSTTPSIVSDTECARICKAESSAKVIMVGTHASALPEETLREAKGSIDVIALGEFDHTIRDIVEHWPDLSGVTGLCFLTGENAVFTAPRPFIQDLDALPFPAWEFLDITKYFDAGRLYPHIDIIGGRGCPYRCTFCQWPQLMFGHRYRFRSPGSIADEIEHDLRLFPKLKYGEFFFEDDTFTVNRSRAIRICDEILRRGLKIHWSVNARPDLCDSELFQAMKRAGCYKFLVGFESGDQQILDGIKKDLKLEKVKEFMALARQAKIGVHGCFVLGLPGETRETAKRTVDFALGLGLDTLQISAAMPLPGSEYYDYCKEKGLLRAKSWEDWLDGGEQGAVVDYPDITLREINALVDDGLKKFYLRPQFILKFLFHNVNLHDFFRKLRGGWNFLSYLFRS